MLSGLLIKIIRFLFFHFTSPPPLVYLMFTPIVLIHLKYEKNREDIGLFGI